MIDFLENPLFLLALTFLIYYGAFCCKNASTLPC